MKKRSGLLAICLMLLVLTGCACKHEWTAADCLNPQVCAKCGEEGTERALGHDWAEATCQTPQTCRRCGETEGQALAHDWAEATCQAPKTCRLCGETQGEALGHSFGDWRIEDTQMTHICALCGEQETVEIDRELYFRDNIVGAWDFYAVRVQGKTLPPSQALSYYNNYYYLNIMKDGTLDFYNHEKGTIQHATWEFKEYQKDNVFDVYSFTLHFEDASEASLVYVDGEGIYLFMSQSEFILFQKNDETTANLANTYVGIDAGALYTLSLNADRTFTGNLDGDIQGTWWLSDENSYGYHKIYLYFSYTKDGEQKLHSVEMYLGSQEEDMDIPQYIQTYGSLPSMNLPDGRYISFKPIDENGVQEIRDALKDSGKQLTGTWNSTSKSIYFYSDSDFDSEKTGPCTDYTITFSEDGTFTSNLEDLPSGTWAIDFFDRYFNGVEYSYSYHYTITAEGVDYDACLNSDGSLYISYNNSDESNISFDFTQMSREQLAQLTEETAGIWNCVSSPDDQGHHTTKGCTEYSITLAEDGTFSGNLDGEVTGTWWVTSETPERCAVLVFLFNDATISIHRTSINSYDGSLYLWRDTDGNQKNFILTQMSREQIAQLTKKAAGTWTSCQVYSRDDQGQEIVENSTEHSITLAEDGTFTGNLDGEVAGTWWGVYETPEGSLQFYFQYDSMQSYYQLSIDSSGALSLYRDIDGNGKRYIMKKGS